MRNILAILLFLSVLISCKEDPGPDLPAPTCNGNEAFCTKLYSEMAFLTTHNAYNYLDTDSIYPLPNQYWNIREQLNNGVRALMLDIYYPDEWFEAADTSVWLYHSTSLVGKRPLAYEFEEIKAFMDANSFEIITLIIENYVSVEHLEGALNASGLSEYLFEYNPAEGWPELGTMSDRNERLVILSEADLQTDKPWFLYVWDHVVETPFSIHSRSEFDCSYNRGQPENPLFLMNHFITSEALGLGQVDSAAVINEEAYLLNRINQCESELGRTPNFIAVDFVSIGNARNVVDQLNNN